MPQIVASGDVLALRFTTNLIAVCRDGQAHAWNPQTLQPLSRVSIPGNHRLYTISQSADLVASADAQQLIHLHSLRDGKTVQTFSGGHWLRRLGLSPDSRQLASSGDDGLVRVWDIASGKVVWSGPVGDGSATQLTFTPDGKVLFCANNDTDLRQWDSRNGEMLRRWDQFPLTIFSAQFSRDGRRLVLGGADHHLTVLDAVTGKTMRTIDTGPELVAGLALSPTGDRALVGGMNKDGFRLPVAVSYWDLQSGQRLWADRLSRSSSLVDLSPDGRMAAWSSLDSKIVLRSV